MWGQLGIGRQQNSDEEQPQRSPGGSLWLRFVQAAADVAQDLVQPVAEDKEEYQEEKDGWDESLGLDVNPSWDSDQQGGGRGEEYYEEGRHQYYEADEQYYEGDDQEFQYGENQFETGEVQNADGEEGEHYGCDEYDEYDQQVEVEKYGDGISWGDEEEVDFDGEDEQNQQDLRQQSDLLLFAEHLQEMKPQPGVEEEAVVDTDQWDLEDEDLFDDNNGQYELPSAPPDVGTDVLVEKPDEGEASEERGFLGDVVERRFGDEGWENYDSLNLNDSQHAASESKAQILDSETEIAAVHATTPHSTADVWNDDFAFDGSQHVDSEHGHDAEGPKSHDPMGSTGIELPRSSYNLLLVVDNKHSDLLEQNTSCTAKEAEGDAWNDDIGFDGSQYLDEKGASVEPPQGDQESQDITGNAVLEPPTAIHSLLFDGVFPVLHNTCVEAAQAEGDGWNDGFGYDGSNNLDLQHDDHGEVPREDRESRDGVGSVGLERPTSPEKLSTDDCSNPAEQGSPGEPKEDGWNENFGFDDSQNVNVQLQDVGKAPLLKEEQERKESVDLVGSTGLEPPTASGVLPADDNACDNGGVGWNDGFGFENSQNKNDEKVGGTVAPLVEQEINETVGRTSLEPLKSSDSLQSDDIEQTSPRPCTSQGQHKVQGGPGQTENEADFDASGDGWGDEDLDVSHHDEGEDSPQAEFISYRQPDNTDGVDKAKSTSASQPQRSTMLEPEAAAGDAWNGDNEFNENLGESEPSEQVKADYKSRYESNEIDPESVNETTTPAEAQVNLGLQTVAVQEGDAWGDDVMNSNDDKAEACTNGPDAAAANDSLFALEESAQNGTWNDSGLNFDDEDDEDEAREGLSHYVSEVPGTQHLDERIRAHGDDDDSTVGRSNIGFEQPNDDPKGGKPSACDEAVCAEPKYGRTPSRRATIRASNTSSARRDSEDDVSAAFDGTIQATSLLFSEITVDAKTTAEKSTEGNGEDDSLNGDSVSSTEKESAFESSTIRDIVSSVSGNSTEHPKQMFSTQISILTLKSMADSCPFRQRGNDSDEDDEDDYGPVVDKTPEVSSQQLSMPASSAMTIHSTAVVAHSINEDIEGDDDTDGTFYGGSTTFEGQSDENAWEGDDASSLGGLHGLGEKIVNFEVPASPIDGLAPEGGSIAAPLHDTIEEQVAIMTPPLNSSMAILFSDDNSEPSRDKDDDNEDDYKPVVDQVPRPPQKLVTEKSGRTLNSMFVLTDNVGALTIQETREGQEIGWDDDGESLENLDEASDTEGDAEVVVDNTPAEACSRGGKSGGSIEAVESTENSCPSRVHDSDEEVYGLVVDQIPTSPPPLLDQMSVAASSMAVVEHNVEEDLKQDEELDASDHGGSRVDDHGVSLWENDLNDLNGLDDENKLKDEKNAPEEPPPLESPLSDVRVVRAIDDTLNGDRVVDLTPKMEGRKISRLSSNSLAVLAHSVNQDFGDNDEDEDEDDSNFGPIVDVTPKTSEVIPNSTPVDEATFREDIKQDETTEGGVGDVNWEAECPELEDMYLNEGEEETESDAVDESRPAANAQSNQNRVVLVDHTPEGETIRKLMGDASLAVLAPSEDGTCASINDDDDVDDIDPGRERVSYGPVVDVTPTLRIQPIGAPSTAPSVTFSLAVEARSVNDDFKLDDEMDETFCGETTICEVAGESGWEDDQTLDTLDVDQSRRRFEPVSYNLQSSNGDNEEGQAMVDHTPQLNSPHARIGDASLVALAPSVASTYQSADEDVDDDDDDSITHEEDLYGKMVDHTPRIAPLPLVKSNSMAVRASSTDFRSEMEREEDLDAACFGESADDPIDADGWGDDEETLEGIEPSVDPANNHMAEETVVDHTPLTQGPQKPNKVDQSVVVLAPSDDGSREDDDNDTYDGNHVYGPVVDMTPHMPSNIVGTSSSVAARHEGELEGTLCGDSSVGPDAGWDEDDAVFDDLVGDEKETESIDPNLSKANLWQASEFISDNASLHLESSTIGKSLPNVASSQDTVVLVDHTPSELESSAQKNSVAWLINVESGISGDETEDAGTSWRGSNAVAGPDSQADGNQVVDRIPQRPELRFGDASTLVVADPSEVLSHVGDMLQEEGDFGPVVDLTPPSRPGIRHAVSGAGSTVVVAPTIVPDDLDDGDADDTVNAAEDSGWEHDPSELEQEPNPQSGNDEETARVRERVVDFLPPQEEIAPDQNRDGWSEVATGGAPSVLQADPKEDEFGPVVDQLPLTHPSNPFSAISTASQVAPSECDALAGEDETLDDSKIESNVFDALPRPFELALRILDSAASLEQTLASEDEDDDDGKYGPVVDHLPSTRSSLPPSRGGSTVDALATVSEVIDDDDDDEGDDDDDKVEDDDSSEGGGNDGWGDDDLGEIDVSEQPEQHAPVTETAEPKSRLGDQNENQIDRGMTVRFRSVVAAIFESNGASEIAIVNSIAGAGNQLNRPRKGASQIFHDDGDDADELNAWDDDLGVDGPFNVDPNRIGGSGNSIPSSPERYTQFAEADTPPATPYSRPKPTHYEPSHLPQVGVTLPDLTLDGVAASSSCIKCENASTIHCPCVQRILKNKEDGDHTVQIDYQKLLQYEISKRLLIEEESKDLRLQLEALKHSKAAGEVRMETVRTLQEHVNIVEAQRIETRTACDTLRSKNQELKSSLDESMLRLLESEEYQKQWAKRESAFRRDAAMATHKFELSLALGQKAAEQQYQVFKAEREVVGTLEQQLGSIQEECSSLVANNHSLAEDIVSLKETLKGKQQEIVKLIAKEASYKVDIKALQTSITELETSATLEKRTASQYEALQASFDAKETAYASLESLLSSLQQRARVAEADHSSHAVLIKQQEEEIAKYQGKLASMKQQLDEFQISRIEERREVSLRLRELDNEIRRLSAEKVENERKSLELQSSSKIAVSEAMALLSQKEQELESALEELGYLQEHNVYIEAELENVGPTAERAARLEDELHASNMNCDTLVGALNEANENIIRLQQRFERQGVEESVMGWNKNTKIESLVSERADLRNTVASNGLQMKVMETHLSTLRDQNKCLEAEITQLRSSCDHLKKAAEHSKRAAADAAENQTKLIRQIEMLEQEVASFLEERNEAQTERQNLLHKCKELESSLSATIEESGANVERMSDIKGALSELQREALALKDQNSALSNECDQYHAKCQVLEGLVSDTSNVAQEVSRLVNENASLSDQVKFVQQEFDNQSVVLQDCEARVDALQNELSVERDSAAVNAETIVELKRDLELTRASLDESTTCASKLHQIVAALESSNSGLEAERRELEHDVASHLGEVESLVNDRNVAIEERDAIAQENEEMLVQFGLLNEQMESLHDAVHRYEQATETTDARLLDLQQQRFTAADSLHLESSYQRAIEETAELQYLRAEQRKLIEVIEELSNANSVKENLIHSITEELESVMSQLSVLEDIKGKSAAIVAENEDMKSQFEKLALEQNELHATCRIQSAEILNLHAELGESSDRRLALEDRLVLLEAAFSDGDQALQQKEVQIRELVTRQHETIASSAGTTPEILDLRARMNAMEASGRGATDQLNAPAASYETSQQDLTSNWEQVSKLEASLKTLEQELTSKAELSRRQADDHERELNRLANKLHNKTKEVAELTKQNHLQATEMYSLQRSVEVAQQELQAKSAESTSSADAEVELLKVQITELHNKMESYTEDYIAREESLLSEFRDVKRVLATKDGEVVRLKHKVQSLSVQLGGSIAHVQRKEDEILKLTSEMDQLRYEQENVHKGAVVSATLLLQHTKVNADDVDNLRATVISLASALEASEGRRADAIDRLLRERETYASSLRHMSDSVKRFYNTLSCGEP